jgi:2-polyprenyl-6-methoxyphenol hydroxylase-like FAD-dependent oxidoreductase
MYDVIVVGARVAGSPTAMLLARRGYKVLVVDKATFPSDTMSTHYIHQPGIAALKRWGLLDRVVASGCPPVSFFKFSIGPFQLHGWGPDADGVNEAYVPRRTVLDKILVDAAREAGAEVREGFSVQDILFEDGRVTGIRGRTRDGDVVTEHARIVVGADGLHSLVARAVQAPTYNERPALACYYYAYWSGVTMPTAEGSAGDGCFYVAFPTHDGQVCAVVGLRNAAFHDYRADIEGTYFRTLDAMSPDLAARLRAGTRESRFTGTADLPNFFRKPYGPGWALVGDAGYHKDPVTGYGITDAFRDAELLSAALHEGLSGRTGLDSALSVYEEARNAVAMPIYDVICMMASMELPPPEMQALIAAMVNNPDAKRRFYGVLDGTVSAADFFSPESVGAIMAAATGMAPSPSPSPIA